MSRRDGPEKTAENGKALALSRLSAGTVEAFYPKRVALLTIEVSELTQELALTRAALQHVQREHITLLASPVYRVLQRMQARLRRVLPPDTRRGKLYRYCRRGMAVWLDQGSRAVVRKIVKKLASRVFGLRRRVIGATARTHEKEVDSFALLPSVAGANGLLSNRSEYEQWIDLFEPRDLREAATQAESLAYRPLISVIMPVYNVDRDLLQAAVQSVLEQPYVNWELCICDDASPNPEVRETLLEAARQDPRIKVEFAEKNGGIAAASNRALALASGEFVAFLDHDDQLSPHALYEVAKLLNSRPDADVIYSDEDKMDAAGQRRYDAFLKPDWSPDLLLSCNYLCHLMVLRTSRVREVGCFRTGVEGSQDYDLLLRIIERTTAIHHIPKVLYHWRACPSSTASAPAVKMYAHVAARAALQEHLERCGTAAKVTEGCTLGRWRVQYKIQGDPRVCIVLPTGGNIGLLDQCIKAVVGNTDYRNFEYLLIDNSKSDKVQSYFPTIARLWPRSRCLDRRGQPFNFSRLNNQAAEMVEAPLMLFLNDDTVPINSGWLEAMVEHAQRPEVGAVGCKLLYGNGTIQHAGVVMGVSANCDHVFKHMPGEETNVGYFHLAHMTRNVSAVTGACLMARREVFQEVGGFEEIRLPVAFQDIDLCLKMRAKGYRIIYTPHARVFHLECQTKAEKIPDPAEVHYMQTLWAEVIAHDPYYHPNLSRFRLDYSLSVRELQQRAARTSAAAATVMARAA